MFLSQDNLTAKYVCIHCKGRTNDKKKLELHLARAHNVTKPAPDSMVSSQQEAERDR